MKIKRESSTLIIKEISLYVKGDKSELYCTIPIISHFRYTK